MPRWFLEGVPVFREHLHASVLGCPPFAALNFEHFPLGVFRPHYGLPQTHAKRLCLLAIHAKAGYGYDGYGYNTLNSGLVLGSVSVSVEDVMKFLAAAVFCIIAIILLLKRVVIGGGSRTTTYYFPR